jgi:hypothetical protein
MLPLFAMQLAFMGFANSVPQGLWFQYTAGLTPNDYQAEWSFMTRLVLAKAAARVFEALSTSVNYGAMETTVNVDGLMRRVRYSEQGPFAAQIKQHNSVVKELLRRAKQKAGGIHIGVL